MKWSTDRTSQVGAGGGGVAGQERMDPVQISSDKGRGAGDRGWAVESATSTTVKQTPWSGVEERERRVCMWHIIPVC
jgi:hypothetical protein